MSIIMPSGNKSVQDWTSETENGLVKTASTGSAPKDFRTTLYEAAKKSVEAAALRTKKQVKACECVDGQPAQSVEETSAMPTTDMAPMSEVSPVAEEEAVDVTVDDKGEISDVSPSAALDKAKAALTDAMTAIDEAQASVGGEEVGEVSVDIPVEEETKEEKPFDFDKPEDKKEDEDKPEDKPEDKKIVESDEPKEKKENPFAKKDDKKEEKEACMASVDGYYKISMVSKETRDAVYNYYKDLGLPEDFCKLMVTNYEK